MEKIKLLQQQLEELENRQFQLDMVDKWSKEDHDIYDRIVVRINEIRLQITTLLKTID